MKKILSKLVTSSVIFLMLTASKLALAQLGSAATDLVFTPITPCRVIDTRTAGGLIASGGTRSFEVTTTANYSAQGGSATNCGSAGANGNYAAALINFTVVTPSAGGYITAFPTGDTQPVAATVNFEAGSVRGNSGVIKLRQTGGADLTVYASASTHLVADLLGYYAAPKITALTCVDTAETSVYVEPGAGAAPVAPACDAGYTETALSCRGSTYDMPVVYFANGTCYARNNGTTQAILGSARRCCQLPGR